MAVFLAYRTVTRGSMGINLFTIFVLTLVYLQIVFVSSIIGGVTQKFNELMIDYQTGNLVIEPKTGERYISDVASLRTKLEHLPYVTGLSPRLKSQAAIYYKDRNLGAAVYGIDPVEESSVTKIGQTMLSGDFVSRLDRGEIVLGREVSGGYGALMDSRSLGGVKVGDIVSVSIGSVSRDYKVKGIYSTNFFLSDSAAYVSRKDLEEILGKEGYASEIAIKTVPGMSEDTARTWLLEAGVREQVRTWEEFSGILKLISDTLTRLRDIFSLIGLLVAFIVIFVVIFVNIVNKKRQIGVEKAIGIDQDAILLSFVLQAMFYAFLGMILGYLIMQYGLTPYTIDHPIALPLGYVSLKLEESEAVGRATLLFIAAVIGSAIPAYQIVRRDALELIRG